MTLRNTKMAPNAKKGISNLKYLKPSKWGHPTVFEIDYWNLVQKPIFHWNQLYTPVGVLIVRWKDPWKDPGGLGVFPRGLSLGHHWRSILYTLFWRENFKNWHNLPVRWIFIRGFTIEWGTVGLSSNSFTSANKLFLPACKMEINQRLFKRSLSSVN